jgi:hypothetical protein
LPVIPSIQAIASAKPNTAIPGRQDARNEAIGQPLGLFHRNRGDGEVAKAIEAITGDDPNIAFTILEETVNEIAGEAVRSRKLISPSLVHMQHSAIFGSDPQTTITIPEQF